jgi:hypothetical protein
VILCLLFGCFNEVAQEYIYCFLTALSTSTNGFGNSEYSSVRVLACFFPPTELSHLTGLKMIRAVPSTARFTTEDETCGLHKNGCKYFLSRCLACPYKLLRSPLSPIAWCFRQRRFLATNCVFAFHLNTERVNQKSFYHEIASVTLLNQTR